MIPFIFALFGIKTGVEKGKTVVQQQQKTVIQSALLPAAILGIISIIIFNTK